ncbi:MAG: 4-hydroxy-tetrahydrodipicolinate synthase [Hydrogenophilales bacterium CG17_big_fil_post_rev_8_21_14_2_50_63_12]|nr:MAG: 4-hydroxy-tetrahydrodipicolinate synthase [Hydrogenophilales bacterium CG17_big_fil_post_rev_8_21_14_2_50_63_12]PIX95984.1 MAG: 4-hydroxy-tetrahydrodipicolinate synthase [Hydrogenophilales bacterium CG_4_10_14_3_um_filter_63_21]PJB02621.1 MAG: 4-hydroxy-tetrahydrodipicolinate synthase [Hydrogenophilales bacterium CG_4_9_14_3_um_filter_63_34]
MFTGSLVALVTPMLPDGSLDLPRFRALIDWHIEQGTDGLVIVGTTGESPTVDAEEHCLLIRTAVEQAAGRIPVIAGTGANSTREAIELTRCAQTAGAAAGLSVAPYYNKPTQEGLFRHFKAIAESSDLPLILYNVPGRTASDISNDTALALAAVPGVIGIKDATGNIERGSDLIKRAPASFSVYSGDDASCMVLMLLGGRGVISVTANVAPRLMHEMSVAAMAGNLAGNLARAREINSRLLGLHQKLFVEANPIPVKWALAEMGRIGLAIRLPLVSLSAPYHDTLRHALKEAGSL